ncbi:YoaV [Paenibacillus terrae HPL-003]|uniref:YoaV n=1 Tax=Paenibacillus terrae (strain HPL-003) TaxID=985665 RepID=G7W333_PAETH|nr:DMT family transporter [Paenibacillus terrae]AET60689.1 YoaV [Paenibacillus terrae HPL-003]
MKGLSLLLCLIWGFNFVIMKLGNRAFEPVQFAAFRFLTGTLLLFGILMWKRVPNPDRHTMKWVILCGILQTTYFNIAIQISLNYINAGLTSVLTYSMPLFLSVMAHFMIPGERLNTRKTIGIATGIMGLLFAMDIHLGGNLWAMLLGVSSAVAWALSNLIIKLKLQHCDKTQFTTWQMAFGALGLLLYSLLFERWEPHFSTTSIIYILFSGIVASALAFLLWTHILTRMEASKASVTLLLVPIIGVVSGWIFLHEELKAATLLGIFLVLAGIWIVNRSGAPKPQ